jgi:hypothetical protein
LTETFFLSDCFVNGIKRSSRVLEGKILLRLTFANNQFVLTDPRDNFLSDAWKPVARHIFQTTNIKEAVRFRKHADSKAEMIFKKLMLKRSPLPLGGLFFTNAFA